MKIYLHYINNLRRLSNIFKTSHSCIFFYIYLESRQPLNIAMNFGVQGAFGNRSSPGFIYTKSRFINILMV